MYRLFLCAPVQGFDHHSQMIQVRNLLPLDWKMFPKTNNFQVFRRYPRLPSDPPLQSFFLWVKWKLPLDTKKAKKLGNRMAGSHQEQPSGLSKLLPCQVSQSLLWLGSASLSQFPFNSRMRMLKPRSACIGGVFWSAAFGSAWRCNTRTRSESESQILPTQMCQIGRPRKWGGSFWSLIRAKVGPSKNQTRMA